MLLKFYYEIPPLLTIKTEQRYRKWLSAKKSNKLGAKPALPLPNSVTLRNSLIFFEPQFLPLYTERQIMLKSSPGLQAQ